MPIIRENINFQRGLSDEGIKTAFLGFRVGQIIIQKDAGRSRQLTSVFVIEHIVESQLPEIDLTIMGLGYIYDFIDPGKYFEFSIGLSNSTGDPNDFRALTEEEMDMIREAIKDKPEQYEDKKRWFDVRTGEVGKKILLKEDFKRGLSSREIKDRLVGFRPGQLFTYEKPWAKNKPFKEVYMFIRKAQEGESTIPEGGTPIKACYIGALSQRDGKLSQFLVRNKKVLGLANLWQEEKRSLTDEEIEKVKKTFLEMPEYFKKITEETGLVPSIK
jgi:hypothetical protein